MQRQSHHLHLLPIEVETLSLLDTHIQLAEVVGDYIESEDIQMISRKKSTEGFL